jgi:hypothetical protein
MREVNNRKKSNISKNLIFIHTPKCGGSYVSSVLTSLKIQNIGHNQATGNENGITFTVIRNPVDRFESLLNYRLSEPTPRNDWPMRLRHVYNNKNITLNEIVSNMNSTEILGFYPFKTLTYWTKNIDIIITIEQLPEMLKYFGYTYDTNSFKPANVSNKLRGTLNKDNVEKLRKIYYNDLVLYNKITKWVF